MRGSSPTHRRRGRAVVTALMAATLLALAACGDDDEDGASGAAEPAATTAAADRPTGEPIKAMTVAAVNWNGPAYPNILETAKLYERYINDRGGIAGRPLEVTVCDEMGDPNQLATCGRNAVSDGAIAVVGSFTLTGDRIVPILEEANVSWFGICCPVYPAEQNSPITFAFGAGQPGYSAYAVKAAEEGCKKPSLVLADTPTKNLNRRIVENTLRLKGVEPGPFVAIPVAATDYSPQVAQATSGGVDCVLGIISETQWASFLPAFQQTGSDAQLFGAQGNLDEKVAKDFPDVVEGDIVIGRYPNISDPAFADYREAIEQYEPPADLDYNSLGGLGTWTAYVGFKKVVESIDGPVTSDSFLEAANATTALDLEGKMPTMNLAEPWGDEAPEGNERVFNTSSTYLVFDGEGKLTTETPGFIDMRDTFVEAMAGN